MEAVYVSLEDKYRRAWFALLRSQRVPKDSRHDLQERITGKRSTRLWDNADWDKAVAHMQRQAGQHNDEHAHICHARPQGEDAMCSMPQARFIEDICDRIGWRTGREDGPARFAVAALFKRPEQRLRKALMMQADYDGVGYWRRLYRKEATLLIAVLKKEEQANPLGAAPTGGEPERKAGAR